MGIDRIQKEMIRKRLKGVSVPLITPMMSSGEVDQDGLRNNIRFLVESGIEEENGFLLLLGTTGEFSSLDRKEACTVAKIGIEECRNRVPVVVGANHSNIRDVVEFGRYLADIGADAVLVRPVYYWGVPSEEMILRHYRMIADEVSTGIVIYNRCMSNVVDVPLPTLEKLADIDQIVALKDGTHSLTKLDKTIKALSGKISCINGWGELYEPYSLLMGSDGFLSVAANFVPELSIKLFKAAKTGNYLEAERIHRSMMPLLDVLFSGTYGQFIELAKYALQTIGLSGGPARDPLPRATDEQKAAIRRNLEELKKSL